jgi:hypothetical protein
MFLLLPWWAFFGAAGLTWVQDALHTSGLIRGRWLGGWVVVIVALLGLNLYQAYPLARDRMIGFQTLETVFLRTLQHAEQSTRTAPNSYVFVTDPSWSSVGLRLIPQVYPVTATIADLTITEPVLPASAAQALRDPNVLVIIKPWLDPAWQQALEPQLRGLGKQSCIVRATNGDPRFALWHAPGLEWMCQ